jgi:transcriptional regulator with XRE-family HTH domain
MKKSIGQRIAERRKAIGLTQEMLAEAMGVSGQAVSKWENDISCPDITLLPALAKKLGMTLDELLVGEGESPRAEVVPLAERKDFSKMMLRIKVLSSDGDKVNINIPMPLLKALIDMGVSPNMVGGDKMKDANIDWKSIMMMIENGVIGKLMEIESSDGDTVEIVVE